MVIFSLLNYLIFIVFLYPYLIIYISKIKLNKVFNLIKIIQAIIIHDNKYLILISSHLEFNN